MTDWTPNTEAVWEQYTQEQPTHVGTVAELAHEWATDNPDSPEAKRFMERWGD